jgi:hypothetical protein
MDSTTRAQLADFLELRQFLLKIMHFVLDLCVRCAHYRLQWAQLIY